jgi:hypothetical protein
MSYDSTKETIAHCKRVQELLYTMASLLIRQGINHDASKLESPEKELFDTMTPKLKDCTYGSEEYKSFLKDLKPALDHHYKVNSHHPEHTDNGFSGMNLLDVLELFCDWKAASERHKNGNFQKSIEINAKRFNMDPQLVQIFENTRKTLNL